MPPQDGGDILQGDANAGADVEYPALKAVRDGGEVNAERGILVVDEVVLLIAALGQVERLAAGRPLDDLAGHAHIAVARRLARAVGGGEAEHHHVEAERAPIERGILT